jgi:hypothetical protein
VSTPASVFAKGCYNRAVSKFFGRDLPFPAFRVLALEKRRRWARHRYAAVINWTCMARHEVIPLPRCEIVLPEEAHAHVLLCPALAPTQSRSRR